MQFMDSMPTAQTINILDIAVVLILGFTMFLGYKKGLLQSVFNLFSVVFSLLVSNGLFPIISKFLREYGGFYEKLQVSIIQSLGISTYMQEQTVKTQATLINNLPLPSALSKLLLANNNPELYKIFHVSTVEEYIASYIANMVLNGISMIVVFILTYFIFKIVGKSLKIVSKLPIINQLNRIGGLAAGFVSGTLLIWILLTVMSIFAVQLPLGGLLKQLPNSVLAKFFFEHNLILQMISKISI